MRFPCRTAPSRSSAARCASRMDHGRTLSVELKAAFTISGIVILLLENRIQVLWLASEILRFLRRGTPVDPAFRDIVLSKKADIVSRDRGFSKSETPYVRNTIAQAVVRKGETVALMLRRDKLSVPRIVGDALGSESMA